MTYPDLPPYKSVLLEMLVERRSSKELRRIWCTAREVRSLLKSTLGRHDELLGWLVTPLD
ncbi:hypothetical protein K6L10_00110 [Vibrio parahaemolyticus]|uniref:hypothetical protein n=1 Tax=Vibrio parahaemolyticus TaxID=670 RepID=UPI001C92F01D|nr:hypothetical protein [Vibrio parahaemolyticus]MBY4650579.1 hypothetical protein [Vibrio parahaemolyticus]